MKKILIYFSCTALTMILWGTLIFFATIYGCLHRPIAKGNRPQAFLSAVDKEIGKQFVGNFAMAVVKDGVVKTEKFHSAGKPVDRNTVFQVSSLSKWVSAFGIMKLVEEGRLDLDAPVSTYLTRWRLPLSKFDNNEVTVRRLLSHTAGIADGLGYSGFETLEQTQTLEQSLTHAADADEGVNGSVHVGIQPGSAFQYSGGAYTLLQLVVEEVTHQSFASYMKEAVFEPLGMNHSTYVWSDSSGLALAEFYNRDSTRAKHYRYTSLAATSLYTSLVDLELFCQAHLPGVHNEPVGRQVLKPETVELMRKPHARQLGTDIWGLGTVLFAPTDNYDFVIGHDGKSTPPINTAVRLNPETGDGIIVLETGSPLLATKLASEWVFWKHEVVDIFLFSMLIKNMAITIAVGWIVIVAAAIITGIRKRTANKI